jgi:uroporphyrinogen III methyltransferase/synthase
VARLERAEVVLYDELSSQALLEHVPADAEQIYVGKRQQRKAMAQEAIAELLIRHARQGKRVVRLKGGDPFVFGRGGEEAEALARAGVPFEVVPGVSAAVAVPAYAGIPLTHRELADGFEVLTGHGGPARGRTSVVLMGARRLQQNVARLRARGHAAETPAAVIHWGTVARQRTVVGTLDDIAERAAQIRPPAILVAGAVVSLRPALSWFERRPLFGLRVLVTRARHQAGETCRLLEELGAETITMPTIEIRPAPDSAPLDEAVGRLGAYDYLVLTSANALAPLQAALERRGLDSRALAGVTLCAIGPGTARALAAMGLRPDLVPEDHRAEGLLELLDARRVAGRRILIPRAARARQILPQTLRRRGAEVDLVHVYETCQPDAGATRHGLERLEAGEIDVLTFTSASTAENFAAILGPRLEALCAGKTVVAIGPVTAEACRRLGLEVTIMPATYTLPAMVEALVAHVAAKAANSEQGESETDAVSRVPPAQGPP